MDFFALWKIWMRLNFKFNWIVFYNLQSFMSTRFYDLEVFTDFHINFSIFSAYYFAKKVLKFSKPCFLPCILCHRLRIRIDLRWLMNLGLVNFYFFVWEEFKSLKWPVFHRISTFWILFLWLNIPLLIP